tara:strand:+ start:1692 stop:1928 length:237 start_codon:yes stop_codon:yes gene_type:complete
MEKIKKTLLNYPKIVYMIDLFLEINFYFTESARLNYKYRILKKEGIRDDISYFIRKNIHKNILDKLCKEKIDDQSQSI